MLISRLGNFLPIRWFCKRPYYVKRFKPIKYGKVNYDPPKSYHFCAENFTNAKRLFSLVKQNHFLFIHLP